MDQPQYVVCASPEQTQLSRREIVWLEAYKANAMAGSQYPLSNADTALRHYDQLFNGPK